MDAHSLHYPSMASPKPKLKRPCCSSSVADHPNDIMISDPSSILGGGSDQTDYLLESFLRLSESSDSLIGQSFDRLIESRTCDSEKGDMIDRALKLGSVLLEAAKRSARKRDSMHNAVVWPLPPELTVQVFTFLDTQSLSYAAAACSSFHKCAADLVCYTHEPQPAPPISAFSSVPSFSSQSHQSTFPNTITYDMFQYMFQSLVSDVARGQANMALFAESNRQWCDDIRRGLRRNEQLILDPTFDDPAYPPCQSDPYTLPEWLAPIPPPSSFHPMSHPFGSQSSGPGVFSTGYQTATTSSWGGFAQFAQITTGMSSIGLDSSVRTTTESMPSSSYHVDPEEEPDAED